MNYLKFLLLAVTLLTSCSMSDMKQASSHPVVQSISNSPAVAQTAQTILGDRYANKYFYEPRKDYPRTPASYNMNWQDVYFKSDNATLHGWFIPSKNGVKNSKVTIVYSHGNLGTVGYHVNRVRWMHQAGFNVLMYDYRGYGKSTGKITQAGLIRDSSAAFRYAANRTDISHTKLVSYGHSLGGAKSITALGKLGTHPRIIAAVDESSFASYDDMSKKFGGRVGAALTSDANSPFRWIAKITKPVYLIHGTNDTLIPLSQAHKNRRAMAGRRNFTYWEVQGGSHYNCMSMHDGRLRKRLISALNQLAR